MHRPPLTLPILLVLATACGSDTETPPARDPEPVARATYHDDVAPMLARRCTGCHQAGGIAPFALTDYDSVASNAGAMIEAIEHGIMPPFDAREDADCTPRFGWVDDPRLTTDEKNVLHTWIEDGFARGDERPAPRPPNLDLAGVTRTVQPTTAFVTSGTRDQFTCFVLDPGNTTDQVQWLTGLQVKPGNALVVHHAVITQVGNTSGEADALVAQRGLGQPFACEDMATPGDFVVHIWTPGNQPFTTQGDIAVPILPRAKLVMQIHYHPAGMTHEPDRTALDLRITSAWPRKMYFVGGIGNELAAPNLEPGPGDAGTPRFLVPANAADHTERMFRVIDPLEQPQDVRIFSVNPHMHLIGTHIQSKIVRASSSPSQPATECLANGRWNFDWQRTYVYDTGLDALPSLAPGDRVEVNCRWNNTLDNPFVQRMLHDANLPLIPIDVGLGEQTNDEMCLEIFGLSIDAPPRPALAAPAPQIAPPSLLRPVTLRELVGAAAPPEPSVR